MNGFNFFSTIFAFVQVVGNTLGCELVASIAEIFFAQRSEFFSLIELAKHGAVGETLNYDFVSNAHSHG